MTKLYFPLELLSNNIRDWFHFLSKIDFKNVLIVIETYFDSQVQTPVLGDT